MKKYILASTLGLLALTGCAKKRPTERVLDFDGNRYPKSALLSDDKWMYKATVVKTSGEGGFAMVGTASPMHIGRFEFGRDKLFFNSNVSPYADKGEGLNPDLINSWEVEHSEYRLAEADGKVLNTEEENNKISWDRKSFFKINWTSQAIDFLGGENPCFKKVGDRLVEGSQEVSGEHFSFMVEQSYQITAVCNSFSNIQRRLNSNNLAYSIFVKHSFAPLPKSDYQPMTLSSEFDKRRAKYGFFETVVDKFSDERQRFERALVVNRWDPNKEHTFYFAEDFPAEYKWIYNHPDLGIGKATNDLFERNGIKMRVKFVDDPKAKYGDVRYSFIKIVEKTDDQAPLGYGPSDVNPVTGEILRADSVIWTAGLKEYIRRIKDFENDEPALESENLLFQKMRSVLEDAKVGFSPNSDVASEWLSTARPFDSRGSNYGADESDPEAKRVARAELQKIIAANLYSNPSAGRFTRQYSEQFSATNISDFAAEPMTPFLGQDSISRAVTLMDKTGFRMPADTRNVLAGVQNQLKVFENNYGVVEQRNRVFRAKIQNPTTYHEVDPYLAMIPDMLASGKTEQQAIDTIMYRVAVHEFGHNLNLRHNFYGSVDYQNFPEAKPQVDRDNRQLTVKDEAGNDVPLMSKPISSSVMDYLDLVEEYHLEHNWEAYDEAALTFAYSGGAIDLADVAPVASNGKIEFKKREEPRQYLFCTDEHRAWANPFCNTFDSGSTPSEVVMSMIKSYARGYKMRNSAYQSPYWDLSGYESNVANKLLTPVKFLALYEQIDSWTGQMTPYNEFADPNQFIRIRREITDDARRASTLLAAFYAGVTQFTATERQITDEVDDFSGEMVRIGILRDKIYAMVGLGGSQNLSIDNQQQADSVNFLRHLNDEGELGAVVRRQLLNLATDSVELAVRGYESFGRSLFVDTATADPQMLSNGFIERMQIQCFTKAGLKQAFDINPDRFYYFDNTDVIFTSYANDSQIPALELKPLYTGLVTVGGVSSARVGTARYPVKNPSVFGAADRITATRVAIVKIGANYYAAPELDSASGFSFEFVKNFFRSNSAVSTVAQQYITQSKALYDLTKYGKEQPCIDYQEGL